MVKLGEPFRNQEISINLYYLYFFISSDYGLLSKTFFFVAFGGCLLLHPVPHTYADPDPGRQNIADTTYPNPKH